MTINKHAIFNKKLLLCQYGFTLIEVMITVAIVGILATIAIPSYTDYVKRSYVVVATNELLSMQAQMEQHFQDNRSYATVGAFTSPCVAKTVENFNIACGVLTATTFTITATGAGPAAGFTYSINQASARSTVALPTDWGTANANCWITKKAGSC